MNTEFLTTVFTMKLNHSRDSQFNVVTRAAEPLDFINIPYLSLNSYISESFFGFCRYAYLNFFYASFYDQIRNFGLKIEGLWGKGNWQGNSSIGYFPDNSGAFMSGYW